MYIQRKADAAKRERDGLTSYFLMEKGSESSDSFAVTWVDVAPGKIQALHHHPEVQIYVIIAGSGVMKIGKALEFVSVGDCVFIPSNENHGIENTGIVTLTYISAATPAFSMTALYDDGQLTSDAYPPQD